MTCFITITNIIKFLNIHFFPFAVSNRCLENESTREETLSSTRTSRRSESKSSQGFTEEGSKSNSRPFRIPESNRERIKIYKL